MGNHDCTLAKMCFANGTHVQKRCGEGEIVYINTVTHDWMCGIDDGRCPGAFQVGCDPDPDYSTAAPPPPINFCNQTKNPLGDCECGDQNQLWINDDCHQGFFCDNTLGEDVDGCLIECTEGHFLLVDPRNGGSWQCVEENPNIGSICPGKFNTECACNDPDNCPIGDCECDGQVRINHDCTLAKMCFANGTHVQKRCGEGEIVYINTVTHDWMCGIDDGRCPGAFQVGCDPDPDYSTVPPPPPVNFCNKTKNPLGECCGNRQLWINDGCTTGFLCDDSYGDDVDGCLIECAEGYFLLADPRNGGSWQCIKDTVQPICPGKFNTECACDDPDNCPIGDCECDGQLRINHDCTESKYCFANGTFEHKQCPEGEIVFVNLVTHDWMCAKDDGRCPGAFQVGCDPDPDYSTAAPSPTTVPPSGASTIRCAFLTLCISILYLKFF